MKTAKEAGFSDALIADLCFSNRQSVRKHREKLGLMTDFRLVDTRAAEFEAFTPYYYSIPWLGKRDLSFQKEEDHDSWRWA